VHESVYTLLIRNVPVDSGPRGALLMFTRTILATVGLLALPAAGNAATFTSQAQFMNAIGGSATTTETFSGVQDGTFLGGPGNGTAFSTGVVVEVTDPNTVEGRPGENTVSNGALSLSIDNPNRRGDADPANQSTPFAQMVRIVLPRATTFFGIDFGRDGARGVGNDSGTLLAGGIGFDLGDLTPNDPDGQYVGFFGFTSSQAFQEIVFTSAQQGSDRFDDDFIADNLIYSGTPAPVPVPAALPLLLGGMGALGLMRRRKQRA
jgi:hypothetical protein